MTRLSLADRIPQEQCQNSSTALLRQPLRPAVEILGQAYVFLTKKFLPRDFAGSGAAVSDATHTRA
tara:strand:- start:231 stop:428 length:198 start_codon:yes stop_codon:yes gene_type:complete